MVNSFSQILGVTISNASSYREVYETLKSSLGSSPSYITVNNVHTVVECVKNKKYKEAINNSFLSLPDGKPLSIYAKLKGEKNISRIFGPTLFENTLDWGQEKKIKHFFFGSSEETQTLMISNIKNKYPHAIISGFIVPPFKPFTEEENEKFIKNMNDSGADLFWIGLGAPKQELWMYENYKKLNHGIMIGIGAGFDYLAGNIKHAPEWMKNMALEWLYRLIQEPKRLWKRYLVTNTLFLWYIFLELTGLRKFD
jgi:N-acetylglucosaminyldiphosphoundecaprenol N-acetyl-beta-D-mannosaminyltransferase